MSRISFDIIASERPELLDAWNCLADWLAKHPDVQFLDLRRIARSCQSVPPMTLADAMRYLVEQGQLFRVYRVETPDGHLLDEEFNSLLEVPDRLPDRFAKHWVDTSNAEVVSGFRIADVSRSR